MNLQQRIAEIRNGFSATFWTANTLELFERLAFYAATAVLSVFIRDKIGLTKDASTIAGLFTGLIFFLPILAGVFVDRYGFKKTLMACFLIFCISYFLVGLAGMPLGEQIMAVTGKKMYVISVLVLTAIGGSLIKPCIVGTVAKTSRPDVKSLGYSIYYTLVNFGGSFGPIIALLLRENLGIEFVFVMSSITSFLLFLGTLAFYKEPVDVSGEAPVETKTFARVFSDMLLVFGNVKFISFLIIFSGFWIIFWQIYLLLPFYSLDVLHYNHFEILETVDSWTIILVTIPIAAMVQKWKSFTAMTIGILLASISWIIVGATGSIIGTVIGIIFFAVGESTQAPRFYEYVSSLAPQGQTGTFMGFAFLPIAIGSYTAGLIADWLRNGYMQTNPSMMWYIIAAIGLATTFLMVVYDRIFVKQNLTT
jgi:POT family proton-dependent oligopeptide transporter